MVVRIVASYTRPSRRCGRRLRLCHKAVGDDTDVAMCMASYDMSDGEQADIVVASIVVPNHGKKARQRQECIGQLEDGGVGSLVGAPGGGVVTDDEHARAWRQGKLVAKAHQQVDDFALPRAIVVPPALRSWRVEGRHRQLGPPVHEQGSSDVFALLALPMYADEFAYTDMVLTIAVAEGGWPRPGKLEPM